MLCYHSQQTVATNSFLTTTLLSFLKYMQIFFFGEIRRQTVALEEQSKRQKTNDGFNGPQDGCQNASSTFRHSRSDGRISSSWSLHRSPRGIKSHDNRRGRGLDSRWEFARQFTALKVQVVNFPKRIDRKDTDVERAFAFGFWGRAAIIRIGKFANLIVVDVDVTRIRRAWNRCNT